MLVLGRVIDAMREGAYNRSSDGVDVGPSDDLNERFSDGV